MNLFSANDAITFFSENMDLYIKMGELIRPKIKDSKFVFYCAICEKITEAQQSDDWNLRNQIYCCKCHHGGRSRHAYEVIKKILSNNNLKRRLIFEEITPFKKMLDKKFENFQGVEYLGKDKVPGRIYRSNDSDLQHQDMCELSFGNKSMDLICAFDVLEHVYDVERALSELHRVIDDEGFIILTVPFYDSVANSVIRAKLEGETVVNLLPAVYHGNPLSDQGSIVFFDPGRDFIDTLKTSGFDVQLSLGANIENGLFPDGNPNMGAHCWNAVFVLKKFNLL